MMTRLLIADIFLVVLGFFSGNKGMLSDELSCHEVFDIQKGGHEHWSSIGLIQRWGKVSD